MMKDLLISIKCLLIILNYLIAKIIAIKEAKRKKKKKKEGKV